MHRRFIFEFDERNRFLVPSRAKREVNPSDLLDPHVNSGHEQTHINHSQNHRSRQTCRVLLAPKREQGGA